ncbi:cyclic nucleotide-gated channel alpha-3-like [Ptychodera flava]|uniref:cyclic nucleotide-gated channel alpha-3-like n=1 Tax=Ptychodera flava TaxID=63121 RepID=UPI00396A79E3
MVEYKDTTSFRPTIEEFESENVGNENSVCTELGILNEANSRTASALSGRPDGRRDASVVSLFEMTSGGKISDNGFILRDNGNVSTVSGRQSKRPAGKSRSRRSFWKSFRNVVRFRNAVDKKRKISKPVQRRDSFMERFTTRQREMAMQDTTATLDSQSDEASDSETIGELLVVHPDHNFNFYWLTVVSATVVYNMWLMIARQAWVDLQDNFRELWFTLDYLSDFIYLLDIGVQLRSGYLEQGIVVRDTKKLAMHYAKSWSFKLDVATLLPLDLLYLVVGRVSPMLRFPRFLKVYRFKQFYYMEESRTAHPNIWRVINLSHLLFLLIHWFAAIYYVISESIGFASDDVGEEKWAYPQPVGDYATLTRKYLWCVYWSTLTLTTIGDLPAPSENWEYVFQTCSYLIGVFVFATIVGQVGTVVENRNASRLDFEKHLDNTKQYMRTHNVPEDVQRRVQRWYDYTWARGHLTGGGDLSNLSLLPEKMKTELALHVNLETLRKVTIFHECPPEFLHDLVLKMKAFIFTPGDLICRKGEIAREMFIIADGILEVTSDVGEVFTTLKAGDFFGEIGILNLDQESGANKRTADVRSVGYSELFTLSKDDVLSAIKDYPQAQNILEEFGRKRLKHRKSKTSKDNGAETDAQTSSPEGQPAIGVTVQDNATDLDTMFETRIEPIRLSEIQRWSTVSESKTPSDIESRSSEVLKKKLRTRQVGKRRGQYRTSTSLYDDELECQVADITLRMQSLLHRKLGKHYQETEHLRQSLGDAENQVAALESENRRKDEIIVKLEERIKELESEKQDILARKESPAPSKPELSDHSDDDMDGRRSKSSRMSCRSVEPMTVVSN